MCLAAADPGWFDWVTLAVGVLPTALTIVLWRADHARQTRELRRTKRARFADAVNALARLGEVQGRQADPATAAIDEALEQGDTEAIAAALVGLASVDHVDELEVRDKDALMRDALSELDSKDAEAGRWFVGSVWSLLEVRVGESKTELGRTMWGLLSSELRGWVGQPGSPAYWRTRSSLRSDAESRG